MGLLAGHVFVDREGRQQVTPTARTIPATGDFRERDEIAFTIGVIALAAKLAKADGTVTRDEVEVFKRVFPVPREEEANVGHLFNLAKQDVAGFNSYAKQLASLFRGRPGVLEDLLDSLFVIAKADDRLHPGELEYLRSVAVIFGFSEGAVSTHSRLAFRCGSRRPLRDLGCRAFDRGRGFEARLSSDWCARTIPTA